MSPLRHGEFNLPVCSHIGSGRERIMEASLWLPPLSMLLTTVITETICQAQPPQFAIEEVGRSSANLNVLSQGIGQ